MIDRDLPILLVDDYRSMLRIIRNLLRQAGFANVAEATDAEAALALLAGRRFGLVISDWNMQPTGGLALLKAMRADPRIGLVPFIMVTAEGRAEDVLAARDAGADHYLVKPFSAATLEAKIGRALQGSTA
ncbi:MAG TPA: response regulator [Geminicoccus sp.]|uniref:response regulator n=1 Tax=Geminicoccus sp. TaxID=2024832 RepID=UPI002D120A37|nr:response regulator [Geminicoccus sp.]HWL70870.1 response regulator [Geminicoccus sp.]